MTPLAVFGLVGIAAMVVLVVATSVRYGRSGSRSDLEGLRVSGESFVVGARIGSWYLSKPLAVFVVTPGSLFVGPRWRWMPMRSVVVARGDVVSVETRRGFLGSPCLRLVEKVDASSGPIVFASSRALRALVDKGWPVAEVAGRSWVGWT